MFTGLVRDVGRVIRLQRIGSGETVSETDSCHNGLKISIQTNLEFADLQLGASVSCNGVCLTVTNLATHKEGARLVEFFLGPETLRKTRFSTVMLGDSINLEPALRYGDALGGHQVQGHIDGLAKVTDWKQTGEAWLLVLELDTLHMNWVVVHGSIAVMGISLTVAAIDEVLGTVSIMIIPHTLENTNLVGIRIGEYVEVEFDQQVKAIFETCKKLIGPIVRTALKETEFKKSSSAQKMQE